MFVMVGNQTGTPDLRVTYVVRSYRFLLAVYCLPTYLSVIVWNLAGNPRFESILCGNVVPVAASCTWPAKLCVYDG